MTHPPAATAALRLSHSVTVQMSMSVNIYCQAVCMVGLSVAAAHSVIACIPSGNVENIKGSLSVYESVMLDSHSQKHIISLCCGNLA